MFGMRQTLRAAAFAVAVATSAAAQDARPATAASIAGTYDLEIIFGGGAIEGKLQLTAVGDSLTVKLDVGDHQSPVKVGERKGNKLTLVSTSPAMSLKYDLEFGPDTVKGTFDYDGNPGTVTGKRKRAP
jgi:opacity protein-like surface antigen